ncbi:thiosulfate sulfurtransferase [Vararia minispora EC-137]|uniref:Thiosulfate sulfurtransferase n=1 Tax=Vararia minispora EC-137 TaxID=1314806 RepID=A0ACB8QSV1_9AGAM|nr:thiosulfate sulfurtransferase [Vararia minispora EC-137]
MSIPIPLILSAKEANRLVREKGPGAVTFVDASWHMPNSPRKAKGEFLERRIPGAQFFDLDEIASSHALGLKHMMPEGSKLASALRPPGSLGIMPGTHVIFYDSVGVFSSPRALFTLRSFGHENSSILNGGIEGWKAEGFVIEDGSPQPSKQAEEYPAPILHADVIQDYEQIVANTRHDPKADEDARVVLDARSRGRYLGSEPEPRPSLSSGHIPHSLSVPFNTFLRSHACPNSGLSYTTLLPREGIIAALETAVGKDTAKDILSGRRKVTMTCGSGMTAAVLWLGLKSVNPEIPVSIYDESWTGYAMRPESEIVMDAN